MLDAKSCIFETGPIVEQVNIINMLYLGRIPWPNKDFKIQKEKRESAEYEDIDEDDKQCVTDQVSMKMKGE